MKRSEALSVSIGVLGGVDTYLTATVLPLPVWVTFIAWASFFIVGGGTRGLVQSIACNITGIVIASSSLLAISLSPASPLFAGICVGVGSAAMVQASKFELLAPTPAIVWGFASTVGTTVATGVPITTLSIHNPGLVAAAAMIVGALFGYASEIWGNAMQAAPAPGAALPEKSAHVP